MEGMYLGIWTYTFDYWLITPHSLRQACVFGLEDKILGEEVGAVVRVKPDFNGKVCRSSGRGPEGGTSGFRLCFLEFLGHIDPVLSQVTEAELIALCKKHLAPFKVPIQIDVRYTDLPITESGKVLKRQLKMEANEARKKKLAAKL
jgi:acyl-CoA synthetase (AMP-forming)/AMP-acid ligase II